MDRDVIIIGGGPSGLSTALHLQRTAPHLASRILILEKEQYPRFKLCAGGLTLDAEILLERLGLDVNEVPHVTADNIHFDFAGKGLNIHIRGQHALRVIRRNEFDHWLAKKAKARGIEIREGVTVKNIIPQADKVIVETDQGIFEAQAVVGADGSNGITRRILFPNAAVYTARVLEVITPEYHVIARRAKPDEAIPEIAHLHLRAVQVSGKNAPRNDGDAYFEFSPVPDNIAGYIWDFPTQVNGEAMRCWGIYDTNLLAGEKRPQLKEVLAQEMSRLGFNLENYEIKGHPIRWFSPDTQMSVPRVLLVGDAVGADPIFGEGISIALGYGAVAAREISEAFQRNEFSFRRYKRRVAGSALGQTLIARWIITYIIYPLKWRWFQILLWRFLKPIVLLIAWIFVLNWGKRMHTLIP
jgi:flavin-dependent dehydrogenase